jgi:hypothetical protein
MQNTGLRRINCRGGSLIAMKVLHDKGKIFSGLLYPLKIVWMGAMLTENSCKWITQLWLGALAENKINKGWPLAFSKDVDWES